MTFHPAIAAGRTAVITGGASGIGLAVAHRLGAVGMRLLIADIDEAVLQTAAEGLHVRGIAVETLRTDVSDPVQVAALKRAADAVGPVSLLMNNAGREGGGGILAGPEVWERTIATNLMGTVWRAAVSARYAGGGLAMRDRQHRIEAGHHAAAWRHGVQRQQSRAEGAYRKPRP